MTNLKIRQLASLLAIVVFTTPACYAHTVGVVGASPTSKLDKIEEDLAVISQFLRQSITDADTDEPAVATKADVTVKADLGITTHSIVEVQQKQTLVAPAPVHPRKESDHEPVLKAVDSIAPANNLTPFDVTVSMFPESQNTPDPEDQDDISPSINNAGIRFRARARPHLPMPEVTPDSMPRLHFSRDAVTCPGFPVECSNNGMCNSGICMCDAMHTGADCSSLRCLPLCVNENGFCMNGTCVCNPGWGGASCEIQACFPPCGPKGKCVTGKCECAPGYAGATCEEMMCPGRPQCGGELHGLCDTSTGKCVCRSDWGGRECLLPNYACVYECLNGAVCNNGTCECEEGFEGPDCGALLPPEKPCMGGSVWSLTTSPITRTCSNLNDAPPAASTKPSKALPKCACPEDIPIWDEHSEQCVEEAFCHVGVCGEMDSPGPSSVVLSVKTKPSCAWTKQVRANGTCHGCVDASQGVTVCYKAGYKVARQITAAQEVNVVLIRRGGPCAGEADYPFGPATTMFKILNTTTVSKSSESDIDSDNSASVKTVAVVHSQKPNFGGLPRVNMTGAARRSVGSVTVPVACTGHYSVYFVIVDKKNVGSSFGMCGIDAENASCPGSPVCSSHGVCTSDYTNSTCQCDENHFGQDCSLAIEHVGNQTVTALPLGISTTLPIPVDAAVTTNAEESTVTVAFDNTTYVFFPNGTLSIATADTKDPIVVQTPNVNEHGCHSNTIWSSCSLGCTPTCRNPQPRCMPTCLTGSCYCPHEYPLWDETKQKCVTHSACAASSSRNKLACPGIGAVCSNKGSCVNGKCKCIQGYSGDDCSTFSNKTGVTGRVTTKSGTVQSVRACHFPFKFRGRIYDDCTTDFDSNGTEWCSITAQWDQQWGYCAPRGACPEVEGIVCNGRGECVNGSCVCETSYSGVDCSGRRIRYTNETFEVCQMPFLGPGNQEYKDCVAGVPVPGDDGQSVSTSVVGEGSDSEKGAKASTAEPDVAWCLTSFRYQGEGSVGFCQPRGSCGNCSAEGGVCDPAKSGKCICKPGFSGLFCTSKLTEREILIKLFADTNGYEWTRRSGWGNEGSPCEFPGWTGVTCRDGHVVRLNLDSAGLTGTIPSDLAALSQLEVLDLSNNRLVGTFPDSLLHSPVSLKSVTVSGNLLVGATPVMPSRVVYADFSQNYMAPPPAQLNSIVGRVTDSQGTVFAYTPCAFPFEFYGRNYTSCTTEWSASGKPWCSTTREFQGSWGGCAEPGTCQGQGGKQCSGHGTCKQVETSTGAITGQCVCEVDYRGEDCAEKIVRVTRNSYTGAVVEQYRRACRLPFEYKGKVYHDCTTDESETGAEWCLLTGEWQRKWGYCAPRGTCPGAETPCSGHGTCNQGECVCEPGWIWNDCSRRAPRVTLGIKQKPNVPCYFPFSFNGVMYHDCARVTGPGYGNKPICALESGELMSHNRWDVCAPYGTCPGSPGCSGNGVCDQGECICNAGFSGVDCSKSLDQRDILIKLFRATQGQQWTDKEGWEFNGNVCEWAGVFCNDKREVITLSLSKNNLDGTLPADLGLLTSLRSLDVSDNHLAGTVPSSFATQPSLVLLNLSNNQFVGALPAITNATVVCESTCIQSPQCSKGTCTLPF